MSIRKKFLITIAIIILTFIFAVIALAIFIKNYVEVIYKENSADGSIQVVVQTDFFAPSALKAREYTVIVYENSGFFRNKLLDKTFWYVVDGAPNLQESDVDIKWLDNSVKVRIKNPDTNDKIFTCDF